MPAWRLYTSANAAGSARAARISSASVFTVAISFARLMRRPRPGRFGPEHPDWYARAQSGSAAARAGSRVGAAARHVVNILISSGSRTTSLDERGLKGCR